MLKVILEDILVWALVARKMAQPSGICPLRIVINLTHGLTWLYSFDCLWSKINIVLPIVGKNSNIVLTIFGYKTI